MHIYIYTYMHIHTYIYIYIYIYTYIRQIWVLFPHILALIAYMVLLAIRITAIYEKRIGSEFPGDWRLTGTPSQHNDFQFYFCPICFAVLIPFLSINAWRELRIQPTDWDPNEDQSLSFQEVLIAVFKNLGSVLNFSAAITMTVQLGFWYQTRDLSEFDWPEVETNNLTASLSSTRLENAVEHWEKESEAMALICLILWCKVLHLLTPFRTTGTMLIMVWRMLISDIPKW